MLVSQRLYIFEPGFLKQSMLKVIKPRSEDPRSSGHHPIPKGTCGHSDKMGVLLGGIAEGFEFQGYKGRLSVSENSSGSSAYPNSG